ncbi:hypothetical protein NKI74_01605 [Mesorhizobium sp. M0494]|uniref:hypothetical protein n=1 Tax=Mesorhizobium sp. M0494 TaxID=2956951 RepID=UPI0033368241
MPRDDENRFEVSVIKIENALKPALKIAPEPPNFFGVSHARKQGLIDEISSLKESPKAKDVLLILIILPEALGQDRFLFDLAEFDGGEAKCLAQNGKNARPVRLLEIGNH